MTFENISSTKTLETKASTSVMNKTKTSAKGGGKTNLRTFSSNIRFFLYDIFTVIKWPLKTNKKRTTIYAG